MSDALVTSPPPSDGRLSRLGGRGATLVPLGLALLLVASVCIAAALSLRRGPPIATSVVGDHPQWIDMPRPTPAFTMDAPMLRGLARSYSARRRANGLDREDLLAFGMLGDDGPSARVRVSRLAAVTTEATVPLFATVAREAADAGLSVQRAGLPDLVPTRFGAAEIVDVSLITGDGQPMSCTGFRLTRQDVRLTLSGLACGALGRPLERAALGCVVDALDLASPGEDHRLVDLFATADAQRAPRCVGARAEPDGGGLWGHDGKPDTLAKSSRRH